MGLDMDGEDYLFGEPLPALENGDAFGDAGSADVGLHIEVVKTERSAPFERWLQGIDAVGQREAFKQQAPFMGEARHGLDLAAVEPERARAVKAGSLDDIEPCLERWGAGRLVEVLEGPERLQDKQLLHHRLPRPGLSTGPRAGEARGRRGRR